MFYTVAFYISAVFYFVGVMCLCSRPLEGDIVHGIRDQQPSIVNTSDDNTFYFVKWFLATQFSVTFLDHGVNVNHWTLPSALTHMSVHSLPPSADDPQETGLSREAICV
jgi:hypothetical protein